MSDIVRRPEAWPDGEPGLCSDSTAFAGLVFTTQIPDRPDGAIETGSIEAQCALVMANLVAALDAAGSGIDRLLHLTIYLTDMADREAFNEVYRQVVPAPFTARCAVGVAALAVPGMRVEVTAIAAQRAAARL